MWKIFIDFSLNTRRLRKITDEATNFLACETNIIYSFFELILSWSQSGTNEEGPEKTTPAPPANKKHWGSAKVCRFQRLLQEKKFNIGRQFIDLFTNTLSAHTPVGRVRRKRQRKAGAGGLKSGCRDFRWKLWWSKNSRFWKFRRVFDTILNKKFDNFQHFWKLRI